MFSKLEFFIAFRYLKAKRKEMFISITALFSLAGIMLGVATLIIVMSVMNGFREELMGKILGVNSHITIYGQTPQISNYKDILDKINKKQEITRVSSVIENSVMLLSGGNTNGALAKGITLKDLKKKKPIIENIQSDNLENFDNGNYILLGKDLARRLGVYIGDSVKVVSPETNSTLLGTIPRIKTYELLGTFKTGMYEYDSSIFFIPLKMAQLQFKYGDSIGSIEVDIKDPERASIVAYELQKELSEDNVQIVDWRSANASFMSALKIERNVMFLILTLIILIASFNIISGLIMLVNDKNKQIALLRTIGLSKGSLMRIFFICGAFIGFVGTSFGAILGIIFTKNIEKIKGILEKITGSTIFDPTIYFLSELPSKIIISDVIFIVLMSLTLSFLATLYPSYKASKTNPAEVLRYE